MNKFSFVILAGALMLVGAGCAGTSSDSSGGGSAATEEVSVYQIEGLIYDSLYDAYNRTDGYTSYIFTEMEGSCAEAQLGELRYTLNGLDALEGTADIQEDSGLVAFGTTANTMDWYFFDAEGGTVSCSYEVDGETFDVSCEQGGAELCSGVYSGVASK